MDAKTEEEKLHGVSIIVQHLMTIVQTHESFTALIQVLEEDPVTSCLMIRLLWMQLQSLPHSFQAEFVSYVNQVRRLATGAFYVTTECQSI